MAATWAELDQLRLENLSPVEQSRLLSLMRFHESGGDLETFINETTPKWPSPPHVKGLRELFERSRYGRVQALISMPPRHAKTVTIQHGLAWLMKVSPATEHAYVTSVADMAWRKSRGIQRIAVDAGVGIVGRAADYWNTELGGGLLATSIGGSYIGQGTTGVQVFDDPYKGLKDAESPVTRQSVWDFYDGTARNRVEPGGSRIVQHTRWHPDDLIGKLIQIEGKDWEVINYPAVEGFSEEAYTAYRQGHVGIEQIGKPLWPDIWPLEELVPFMAQKHTWWALFMGSPRLRGARMFEEPARFDLDTFNINGCRACIAVDPAATGSTRADYSAIVTMAIQGYGQQSIAYILDVQRLQVPVPQLVRVLRDIQARRRLLIVAEAVGGFKAVPQSLRDQDPNLGIVEITPTSDKFIRAIPLSAAWNEGRVRVPLRASWDIDAFLAEFRRFTGVGDAEDDQVDATAHGWNALYKEFEVPRQGSRRGAELPFA